MKGSNKKLKANNQHFFLFSITVPKLRYFKIIVDPAIPPPACCLGASAPVVELVEYPISLIPGIFLQSHLLLFEHFSRDKMIWDICFQLIVWHISQTEKCGSLVLPVLKLLLSCLLLLIFWYIFTISRGNRLDSFYFWQPTRPPSYWNEP